MATKYLVQHRRGTAAQWAEQDTLIPREGEIVIEIDEVNSLHKLKIGDGVHTYAELAYLKAGDEIVTQVLAEAKPRVITVELSESWAQDSDDKYYQTLTLDGITNHSRLDLQPSVDMLAEFKQLGLVFVTENNSGAITVYSVGNMPQKAYTMQATIVETECDGEDACVIGAPIGTPVAQSNWTQTDNTKADFIKNKPTLGALAAKDEVAKTDLASDVQASLDKDIAISQLQEQFAVGDTTDEISNVTEWATATSPSGFTQRQRSCCYGNGYYVIAGTAGQMVYSANGIDWTLVTPFTSDVITGLAYGNGRFVAVDSVGKIFSAALPTDIWEQVYTNPVIIESVRYLNNRFVAVGENGFFATSVDAINWHQQTVPTTNTLIDSAYGNGYYIAVGHAGTIIRSINLIDWFDCSMTDFGDIRTAMFTGNGFVIGGKSGNIAYSADGAAWSMATNNTTSTVNWIRAFAYAEKRIYAVMYISTGAGEIWVSKDGGTTWTVDKSVAGRLWCIVHGNGRFITSGDNGAIYVLDLGIEWTDEEPSEGASIWHRYIATLSNGDEVISESYKSTIASHTHSYNDLTNKPEGLATEDYVDSAIGTHNTATDSHNDIRTLIFDLSTAVNNFLDVDDTTTDQLSEVIELINNNKGTLESLTTNKVNVSDIINNLTTNVADKPLSAAQGVALKALIDGLEIPTIPSSLPANGGNADTVDGKHAEDFATASSVKSLSSEVANLKADIGDINSILDAINGEVI